jgi:hypothetical protein
LSAAKWDGLIEKGKIAGWRGFLADEARLTLIIAGRSQTAQV